MGLARPFKVWDIPLRADRRGAGDEVPCRGAGCPRQTSFPAAGGGVREKDLNSN